MLKLRSRKLDGLGGRGRRVVDRCSGRSGRGRSVRSCQKRGAALCEIGCSSDWSDLEECTLDCSMLGQNGGGAIGSGLGLGLGFGSEVGSGKVLA